jgi:hypothetical protein
MKKRVVWQPHLEREPLFNPFVPSERTHKIESIDIEEEHHDEIEVGDDETSSEETPTGATRKD